jgi:hypothetical protein
MVVTCGVPTPDGFDLTAQCQVANGVGWYVPPEVLDDPDADPSDFVGRGLAGVTVIHRSATEPHRDQYADPERPILRIAGGRVQRWQNGNWDAYIDAADRLKAGTELAGASFKVHLDGHNQLDYITGAADESARQHFFYVSDDGDLTALRYDNWKIVFLEQRAQGTLAIWLDPYVELRAPKIYNLRTDPYERADITSNTYFDWMLERAWTLIPAQTYVAQMAQSLIDFPPSQSPASFTINQVMAKLRAGMTSA